MRHERAFAAIVLAVPLAILPAIGAAAADDAGLRYGAPVVVAQPGAFVQLPLPPAVYARSRSPGLADLRLVDARGERVPFALLAPRADDIRATELAREIPLYPLPKIEAGAALPASIEVHIDGGRVQLRARAVAPAGVVPPRPAGWLFDLGERAPQQPSPRKLRLRWSSPAEFSAGYAIDQSEDLREWRPAPGGQLMALAPSSPPAAAGPSQPLVGLPAQPARFVRMRWADPATAPMLTGAEAVAEQHNSVALDPPATLLVAASPEPGKGASEAPGVRALHLDLGGVLDVVRLDLQLPPGTQVIPLWVQQRRRAEEPWAALTSGVVYRIERPGSEGGASVSLPLVLHTQARYLRLVPDERAPAFDAARTTALVQVHLASLVFAAQGTMPYRLLVGAIDTAAPGHPAPALPGALPIATLVPQLEQERPRFGRAELGPLAEIPAMAQQAAAEEAKATWRPRLLWAVLLAGVAALGFMVWRLARAR